MPVTRHSIETLNDAESVSMARRQCLRAMTLKTLHVTLLRQRTMTLKDAPGATQKYHISKEEEGKEESKVNVSLK